MWPVRDRGGERRLLDTGAVVADLEHDPVASRETLTDACRAPACFATLLNSSRASDSTGG